MPRESVHRVSPAEVLLTDVRLRRPGQFEAAARWPRTDVTVAGDARARHSPLMVVETLRQLGIHIPHRYFGVPPSTHFLITDLSWRVDAAAQPAGGHGAGQITCLVASGQPRRAPGTGLLTALRLRVRFLVGERCFAHAEGGARFVDDARYAALRGRPRRAPGDLPRLSDGAGAGVRPEPARVVVESSRDLLIVRYGDRLYVDPADPGHPFFFDHPSDHVPGVVLLEAARQAVAVRSAGRLTRPVACRFAALRFTEFAPRARVDCALHGRTAVFRIRQAAGVTAVGAMDY